MPNFRSFINAVLNTKIGVIDFARYNTIFENGMNEIKMLKDAINGEND